MGQVRTFLLYVQSLLLYSLDTDVVKGELDVVSGLEWKDDLLNKSSLYYKAKAIEITNEVR